LERDCGARERAVLDDATKGRETALLLHLRSGDRLATERFVRAHAGWMLALAQRYVRDAGVAEDCVQEAFLQAFRSIGEFEGRSALKSWLHRIVINTALMKLRSRRCVLERPVDDIVPHIDRECCRMQASWADMATPHEILERKEARDFVVAKMTELPDSYRIVLLLRDIEGMSTEETARALGTTEGAVKVRLHRARAAFKALVAPVLRRYV
jgi:RNA polymerase sigma-70 factor (ECF subfamily)